MDIHTEKLSLIQWLAQLTDEGVIAKIKALRDEKADWWDEINEDEKSEIIEGIAQADRGELTPHSQIKSKYDKWL